MRKYFDLAAYEELTIEYGGANYRFSELIPLAEKGSPVTSVFEYVYQLPTGEYLYVTVVGEEEDPSNSNGIHKGWYEVKPLDEQEARRVMEHF